ncbi:MAG: glycoside hydrolase family 30 protein [Bacteroidales bacterium]|nr:glycoside hydrolase family 30 protein [Bacteroidales bacterium]
MQSDVALYEDSSKKDEGVFPDRLAVNDFFIQDPRYLQTYADYFCKFISAYQEQGIPITKVMFQNEPYSYTPYPGCAWTVEGTIRFNMEYLAPTLKKNHPNIELYMGTFNTNRFEEVDGILSDNRMSHYIKGVGFQWEGGQILPRIRAKYPQYKYMQTESECGWGSFNWQAAEHTFGLINHYLANGCDEYIFWNVILADEGVSTWGWKQNALICVDSKTRTYTYTPEYYAVKHYTNFISPDSRVIAFNGRDTKLPILVCKTPKNKYIVIAGNFTDEVKDITVKLGEQYLNVQLPSHTLHTFTEK